MAAIKLDDISSLSAVFSRVSLGFIRIQTSISNMKSVIVFAALIAFAVAFPQTQDSQAVVITNENNNIGVGDFQSRYLYSHHTFNHFVD